MSTQSEIKKATFQALSGVTAGRCFFGDPRPDVGLPNITYRIDDTRYSTDASSMETYGRAFRLRVEIRNELRANTEWELDDLSRQVEVALQNSTVETYTKDFRLTFTEYEHDDVDEHYGIARLTYEGWF